LPGPEQGDAEIVAHAERAEAVWLANIESARRTVRENRVGQLVAIVSGSANDAEYWQAHATSVAGDVFRADRATRVLSVHERSPKGNLLGTLNAWRETKQAATTAALALPNVGLVSMVFGKGKRLSPLTQALGNCKAALPTPMISPTSGDYLRGGDLSSLYTSTWLDTIERAGFRGLVVKWGDEAMIPGVRWSLPAGAYADVDAIRFVWQTEPDEVLAREKEWVVVDAATDLMVTQYPRENLAAILTRRDSLAGARSVGASNDAAPRRLAMGVNLGSFAISYPLLDAALDVFGADVADRTMAADWDPYGWLALSCESDAEWGAARAYEAQAGRPGLSALLQRYPDFYVKMKEVRRRVEQQRGRRLKIAVLDFGACFWVDMGLHQQLRRALERLTHQDAGGAVTRALFGIAREPDADGNIIVNSQIASGADIRDSVIVDSQITDGSSVIRGGIVIGGRHDRVSMPEGGIALFCALSTLAFDGPSAIALRSVGQDVRLPAGGRHTILYGPNGPVPMTGNESVTSYDGPGYDEPILGNPISYAEAATLMDGVGPAQTDRRWREAWESRG
jgi:hypothetical protein